VLRAALIPVPIKSNTALEMAQTIEPREKEPRREETFTKTLQKLKD
jgi:hypothetical protein